MTDATTTPPIQRTQMSPRARRWFLIGLAIFCIGTFVLGAFLYVVDFRHKTVCQGGKQWISRSVDPLGQVTYVCPGQGTVTQSLIP